MKSKVSVKMQTSRSTSFKENVINANVIFPGIQIGISQSGSWGNFDTENPKILITISGDDYECSIERFKEIVRKHLHPTL